MEQEQYKRQIEKKWNSKALLLANPPEKPIELLERNKLYRVDQLEEDHGEVLQSIREFMPGNFDLSDADSVASPLLRMIEQQPEVVAVTKTEID